jgi:hypothetical protein
LLLKKLEQIRVFETLKLGMLERAIRLDYFSRSLSPNKAQLLKDIHLLKKYLFSILINYLHIYSFKLNTYNNERFSRTMFENAINSN